MGRRSAERPRLTGFLRTVAVDMPPFDHEQAILEREKLLREQDEADKAARGNNKAGAPTGLTWDVFAGNLLRSTKSSVSESTIRPTFAAFLGQIKELGGDATVLPEAMHGLALDVYKAWTERGAAGFRLFMTESFHPSEEMMREVFTTIKKLAEWRSTTFGPGRDRVRADDLVTDPDLTAHEFGAELSLDFGAGARLVSSMARETSRVPGGAAAPSASAPSASASSFESVQTDGSLLTRVAIRETQPDLADAIFATLAETKSDAELQAALFDLLGADNLDLLMQLVASREQLLAEGRNATDGLGTDRYRIGTQGQRRNEKQRRKQQKRGQQPRDGQGAYDDDEETMRMIEQAELLSLDPDYVEEQRRLGLKHSSVGRNEMAALNLKPAGSTMDDPMLGFSYPVGTTREHYQGYERVVVPPAQGKPVDEDELVPIEAFLFRAPSRILEVYLRQGPFGVHCRRLPAPCAQKAKRLFPYARRLSGQVVNRG